MKDNNRRGTSNGNSPVNNQNTSTVQKKGGPTQGSLAKDSLIQRSINDQAKSISSASSSLDTQTKIPSGVQAKMENSFGADFSNVNIHQGDSATQMNALAYTQGNNIHFAPGQYNPDSKSGQELLGHELTHVVQQRNGNVAPTTQFKGVGMNNDQGLETEADEAGKLASEGKAAKISGVGHGTQLKPGDAQKPALFTDHKERKAILEITQGQIGLALTAYGQALQNAKDDFNEELKQDHEFALFLLELGFAFIPGSFGKLISKVVNNIPSKSPLVVYRLALMAQDPDIMGPLLSFAVDKGKGAANEALTTQGKNEGEQFLRVLFNARHVTSNAMNNDVGTMLAKDAGEFNEAMDNKILSYYALTNIEVANSISYEVEIKALLKKFKKEVMPLNETSFYPGSAAMERSSSSQRKLAYIRGRYALVDYVINQSMFSVDFKYNFVQWVSPEMLPFVKSKAGKDMVPPGKIVYGVPSK